MSTEKNSGKPAESYWERRTVLLESVLMNITSIMLNDTFSEDTQQELVNLMHEWDQAISGLDKEFN